MMLIDVKPKLGEENIQKIIALAVFPDSERVKRAVEQYSNETQLRIMGYESGGDIIGIIGYRHVDDATLEIKHIAVVPEERGKGLGRGMILELLDLEKPGVLLAETDEEAVEFYRSNGFSIESLGEKYPGIERFTCTFAAADDE